MLSSFFLFFHFFFLYLFLLFSTPHASILSIEAVALLHDFADNIRTIMCFEYEEYTFERNIDSRYILFHMYV